MIELDDELLEDLEALAAAIHAIPTAASVPDALGREDIPNPYPVKPVVEPEQ